ncbi:MAG: hypothetical protein HZA19_03440 [Nitrospirae bacterium]|nr:hypothetical protein [Nitrospirota bacterium]
MTTYTLSFLPEIEEDVMGVLGGMSPSPGDSVRIYSEHFMPAPVRFPGGAALQETKKFRALAGIDGDVDKTIDHCKISS